MKKVLTMFLVVVGLFLLCGCSNSQDYLRVHIRAHSNSEEDQNVKYLVKDVVVEYMTPLLENAKNKSDVISIIEENADELIILIDGVLLNQGFEYGCSIEIKNEFFPTRSYDNLTLSADYYDALIVNLGSGNGNNWWCVMYPNLCFNEPNNVVYKSKIKEIINLIKGC